MKRSAFTLIELLVVIAIIALLASIAIPVYGSAMEKGHAAKCLANLRQVGQGIMLYTNENSDDFFSRSGRKPWPETVHDKYGIAWKSFRSPFDKGRPSSEGTSPVPISYAVNRDCFDTNVGQWTAPGELIIAAPKLDAGAAVKFSAMSNQDAALEGPGGSPGEKKGTHSGRTRINALFGDGRVESMLFKDFANQAGEVGRRRWDPEAPER